MKERKSILGRGLDELFETHSSSQPPKELSIGSVVQGTSQPRKKFDQEKIQQLAASIRETGVIQPILVRPTNDPNRYAIVAGERRWLAAKEAGLEFIPVVVKDITDREALKIAIIENIQREDLNVIEEAEAFQRLVDEHNYTQDMIAAQVGKSRSHIANTLRLLNLPEEVKDYLINGQISAGHARALINDERAVEKAKDIIENKLNVRSVEKQTKKRLNQDVNLNTDDVKRIENSLNAALKAHATVSVMKDKIRVIIDFSSAWHLEDFMNQLN